MKKKRFLVTGGTGFIGSNICKYLVKQNYSVKIYDNNSRGEIKKIANIKNRVKFIKGDIRDKKLLSKSLRKTDAVIHLAYVNGTKYFYSNPVKVLEIAVKGIINVIDGCIKKLIKNKYDSIFSCSSRLFIKARRFVFSFGRLGLFNESMFS